MVGLPAIDGSVIDVSMHGLSGIETRMPFPSIAAAHAAFYCSE